MSIGVIVLFLFSIGIASGADEKEMRLELSLAFREQGVKVPPPSKSAPESIKKTYAVLMKAKKTPRALTAVEIFGVDSDMPAAYYEQVIGAVQSLKLTREQVQLVVKVLVEDRESTKSEFDLAAKLLGTSGLEVTSELLEHFRMRSADLSHDVDAIIESEPAQFNGDSNAAALKIAKLLLEYGDQEYSCLDKTFTSANPKVSKILNWLSAYGDRSSSNRAFIAKVIRLVLSRKPVCRSDRTTLTTAMYLWAPYSSGVQHEIACVLYETKDGQSAVEGDFAELLLAARAIGSASDIQSPGQLLEQVEVFNQLRSSHEGDLLTTVESELYAGVLKYVVGQPFGQIALGHSKIKVPPTKGHPGEIVKLCKQMPEHPIVKVLVSRLKKSLDAPRPYHEGFEVKTEDLYLKPLPIPLRQDFEKNPKFADDLTAIESECTVLPKGKSTQPTGMGSKTKTKKPKGDFHP